MLNFSYTCIRYFIRKVLIFDLNRDIVRSVRACGSNPFHSFKVDGK